MAKTFNERVAVVIAGLTSVALVEKLAASIATRSANLDVDIHACGIGALKCARSFRDTSATCAVINALGKAARAKAFAEWVEKHSNVILTINSKSGVWTGKFKDAELRMSDDELDEAIVAAIDAPFWIVPEKASRDFSLHAALAQLLKKAASAQTKGGLSEAERLAVADMVTLADKIKPVAVTA